MSLLLDALHRASKDKEKMAASAIQGESLLLAPAPKQPLALVEQSAVEAVADSKLPPLVPPVPMPAAPERELSLSDAPSFLSDLPRLEIEPAAAPLPTRAELSLEIQPTMALVAAAPAATPVPTRVAEVAAVPEPRPVAAVTAAPQAAPTSSQAVAGVASTATAPPLNPSRVAKEIRRAYAENSKSAGTGKRRIYILAGVALALTMAMGSFFLGFWGDPLALLGLGGGSSLAPTAPPAAAIVVPPQPLPVALEPSKPAESASAPVTPAQTVTAPPAQKPAALPQRAVATAPTPDAQASGVQPRPSAAPSAPRALLSNEIVLRPSDGASAFAVKPMEPGALEVAYSALVQGRMEDSARAYEQALKVNPQEPDALLGLAYIAQQQGQSEAAQSYYRRVLRQDPANIAASTALLALESQGSNALSSARVRELVARQPQSAATLSVAGNVLVRDGLFQEAAQMFARAQGLEPGNLMHSYNQAVALDRLGQYAQARDKYQSLLKIDALSTPATRRVFSLDAVRLRLEQLNQALGHSEPSTP